MSDDKARILVVDDTPSNLDVLRELLVGRYALRLATSGERALEIARGDNPPDLILLDIMMPGMDGYTVCHALKSSEATRRIPVIFVTAMQEIEDEARGFECGCVDYIIKPVSPPLVLARVDTHLKLYRQEQHLQALVRERTADVERTRLELIRRLGRAAEYRDDESGLHVIRMSHYARLLALASGTSEDLAETVFLAAPMHDIGKIGIPDELLRKSGPLTPEEDKRMREHTAIGATIIGRHDNELLDTARIIALTHHERWDGEGFPHKLAGEHIPLAGRIVAIADVFDTLTSERPYKKEWPVEQACDYLLEQAGKRFDPVLVARFLEILPEVLKIKETYSELPPGAFS
jgi:putative two-component system response regulator